MQRVSTAPSVMKPTTWMPLLPSMIGVQPNRVSSVVITLHLSVASCAPGMEMCLPLHVSHWMLPSEATCDAEQFAARAVPDKLSGCAPGELPPLSSQLWMA